MADKKNVRIFLVNEEDKSKWNYSQAMATDELDEVEEEFYEMAEMAEENELLLEIGTEEFTKSFDFREDDEDEFWETIQEYFHYYGFSYVDEERNEEIERIWEF